jgi:hypothetical protein
LDVIDWGDNRLHTGWFSLHTPLELRKQGSHYETAKDEKLGELFLEFTFHVFYFVSFCFMYLFLMLILFICVCLILLIMKQQK